MRGLAWFIAIGAIFGIVWYLMRLRRQFAERQEAAEARMMTLVAQVRPTAAAAPLLPPAPSAEAAPPAAAEAPQERLLFDAAHKAGEAGEPALAIQLYAKLLSRFPKTILTARARSGVEEQKKKLAKPQSSG
jgi:TolA-binding protein